MGNKNGFFTISELAKEFDVKKSHIRFCEEKGLIRPRGSKLNRRIYSTYDRARLKLILHCVVAGYSQEQIVELIGMPDANLDLDAQVRQGIEDAQKKIKELEHRRNEAKFHERTSIMTELNMMWEYIEEIKSIKLEDVEKPPAKPAIDVKDKEKPAPEPSKAVKTDVEKKSERQPGRMIPVFAAGLGLVLIIGGYFFYQSVQKKTTPIKLAQKEPAESRTHPIYHQTVPSDQTVEQTAASPTPEDTPDRLSPVQQESLKVDSSPSAKVTPEAGETSLAMEKQTKAGTQIKPVPEAGEKEVTVAEKPAVKKAPAADGLSAPVEGNDTLKAPDAEAKKVPKPEPALMAASAADKISSVPEKQKTGSQKIQPASKDTAKVAAVEEKPAVKLEPAAPAGEKLSATRPETQTEKAPEPEIKETPGESAVKEALAAGAASKVSQDPKIETPQLVQRSEAKTKETVALGKSSVEATPVESGGDHPTAAPEAEKAAAPETQSKGFGVATGISATSGKTRETAATPSADAPTVSREISSAPETETPPADAVEEIPAQPETDQTIVAAKGDALEKADVANRLEAFLKTYCQTYENKNLDKFFTFFAPDASENNRPFHELMPKYRKNMEMIDSFKYRIEILAYSTQPATGNVRIQGKFFTQYLLHGGSWKDNSGNISMELVAHGDSFLVKQLNYGK